MGKEELRIRKKQFIIFWMVLVLVCAVVLPLTAKAETYDLSIDEFTNVTGLPVEEVLIPGDVISYRPNTEGTYTVYYYDSGENAVQLMKDTITFGDTYIIEGYPDLPEGMTFEGWRVDNVNVASGNVLESIILTAGDCTPNVYTIRYELYSGTNGDNPETYTYGIGVESFADATKEGFEFDGWYSEASFENKVTSIADNHTGDITLYAKFTSATSGVPGGSMPEPTVINAGTHELTEGVPYQLGSGVTAVKGDSCAYVSGIVFYVPETGEYIFE